MIPPMSADAKLESFAYFENGKNYNVIDGELSIPIKIEYGANTFNLTNYAKKEHVKKIVSKLFINDVLVDTIYGNEILNINNTVNIDSSKIELSEVLNVRIESSLLTKFTTDGALVDVKEYILNLNFENQIQEEKNIEIKEIEEIEELPDNPYIEEKTEFNDADIINKTYIKNVVPPSIKDIDIKVIGNGKNNKLYKSKKTGNYFVCAGQTIEITVTAISNPEYATLEITGDSSISTFDKTTKNFEWTEPKSRNVKTFFNKLEDFEEMYHNKKYLKEIKSNSSEEKVFKISYIIPYETKQTLESWKTLREKSNDAFSIDESKLFTKITKPYKFVFKVGNNLGKTTKTFELDVFERWDTIYNRDLSKYVK